MTAAAHDERTALVVGGTKGIGRQIARTLIGEGMRVTVVGRPSAAGERAAAGIGAAFLPADVSIMAEARGLAEQVAARHDRLHALVQTADVIPRRRVETAEGFELGFATNYLSRFLLVGLLLDQLLAARGAILHVAAAGAAGRLRLEQVPPGPTVGAFRAHGVGQGANDVYGIELAQRLVGTGVSVHVANPGAVDTGIRDEVNQTLMGRALTSMFGAVMTVRDAATVADILLATASRHPDDVLIGVRGGPVRVPARARDAALRRALWERTEQLLGLQVLDRPMRPSA
jgi:NAD(P)-dependent dehydrogenase (short-subunit alcohol dehydrogenase family)